MITVPVDILMDTGGELTAEASQLGFPVGKWPEVITVAAYDGDNEYHLLRVDDVGGHYHCRDRVRPSITVFND